jgi:hypothetical protein
LLYSSITVCGNIRACTRFTTNLSRKGNELKRGESMSCLEVLLHLWKEKNEMRMVITVHNATMQDMLNRYVEKEENVILCHWAQQINDNSWDSSLLSLVQPHP